MSLHTSLFSMAILLLLCSCALQRAHDAETAKRYIVGMTKEQVFSCMGLPKRKGSEGNTEIWYYDSGNDHLDKIRGSGSIVRPSKRNATSITDILTTSIMLDEETREKRHCIIQIVIKEGLATAINYSGPSGGIFTNDEQCAFAVRNCIP